MFNFWTTAWMLIEVPVAAPDFPHLWDKGSMETLKPRIFRPKLQKTTIGTPGAQYEKQAKAVCFAQMESVGAPIISTLAPINLEP
jgi:hypothetical protein